MNIVVDAKISLLNSTQSNITSLVSPIASDDFGFLFGQIRGTELTGDNLALLRSQIAVAHGKGIGVRYCKFFPSLFKFRRGSEGAREAILRLSRLGESD